MRCLEVPRQVSVTYRGNEVGCLRVSPTRTFSFTYAPSWLEQGFSISPFSLPLQAGPFTPELRTYSAFKGLFGVFKDSIGDEFALTLVKRYWEQHCSRAPGSSLRELTWLSDLSQGALRYQPCFCPKATAAEPDFDRLKAEFEKLLASYRYSGDIDPLFAYGGGCGGTHPKAHILYEGRPAIIKFPSSHDRPDMAEAEYAYNLAAKEAGLQVPPFHLVHGKSGAAYFVSERFDRDSAGQPLHYLSLSGLLEAPKETTVLDYRDLLRATFQVSEGSFSDTFMAFRLACFNLFSHNYDDHSQNFGFLYEPKLQRYVFAPAFDLTPGGSFLGEHHLLCNGKGLPQESDLLAIAEQAQLPLKEAKTIIAEVKMVVLKRLKNYLLED